MSDYSNSKFLSDMICAMTELQNFGEQNISRMLILQVSLKIIVEFLVILENIVENTQQYKSLKIFISLCIRGQTSPLPPFSNNFSNMYNYL